MRRSKEQRQRDRDDLLTVITEATQPITTDVVICRAYGLPDPTRGDTRYWKYYSQAYSDLDRMVRDGLIERAYRPGWRSTFWQPTSSPEAVFEDEDRREIDRLTSSWTEVGA